MITGPAEDRLKIRERLDSYCDAVCRIDRQDYLACWTEDGERLGDGGECHGIEELLTHWDGIWHALERMAFLTQIGAIEVDGDRARTRSYCQEILRLKNGATHRLVGMYEDELRRVDGTWLFSRRTYRVVLREGQPGAAQDESP
ncbi:MAG: nuclear transport factor 2 family protein [Mycobacteriaceae bacterium]|nr:nuclear transport factor 2 family protein [Mycobacteriaceae bacterium]